MLWELQSENEEHIWANCRSHVKISMRDMLLYPKHMAQLRESCSPSANIDVQYPTALPKHCHPPSLSYPSLRLTHQENHGKQNVSNNGELLPWNRIAEAVLFHKQNAHECLWEYKEPDGSSGSGPVFAVVRRKPDSNTSDLPILFLPCCSPLSLSF